MFDGQEDHGTLSRTFAGLLALSMILAPAIVFADDQVFDDADFVAQAGPTPSFSELDANGDGVISYGEAQAHPPLAAVFHDADANGDGVLDRAEFQTALRLLQQT